MEGRLRSHYSHRPVLLKILIRQEIAMFNKTLICWGVLLSSVTVWCSPSGLNAQAFMGSQTDSEVKAGRAPLVPDWKLGAPVKLKNLTIFPITAAKWPASVEYITLDDGLKSGSVKITEMGGEGGQTAGSGARQAAEVNRLSLRNNSGKPLLLIAGEMLLGGQQDRIDASDRIVPPSDQSTSLAVFCVEPGRWNGAEQFGLTARADRVEGGMSGSSGTGSGIGSGSGAGVGPGDGSRNGANPGPAASSAPPATVHSGGVSETVPVTSAPGDGAMIGMANSKVREKAEASRDQVQVWDSVNLTAAETRVVTKSGSLQAVYDDKKVNERLDRYNRALRARLTGRNIVGVVVAINGKVQLADIFATPSLFQAYWPKLLKSYALEAVSSSTGHSADVPMQEARSFLSPVRGEATSEGEDGVYKVTRCSAQGESSFVLEYMAGGVPVIVHFNRIATK
jgi:hypothetical protein